MNNPEYRVRFQDLGGQLSGRPTGPRGDLRTVYSFLQKLPHVSPNLMRPQLVFIFTAAELGPGAQYDGNRRLFKEEMNKKRSCDDFQKLLAEPAVKTTSPGPKTGSPGQRGRFLKLRLAKIFMFLVLRFSAAGGADVPREKSPELRGSRCPARPEPVASEASNKGKGPWFPGFALPHARTFAGLGRAC